MPNSKPPATPPVSEQAGAPAGRARSSRRTGTRLVRTVLLPAALLLITFLGWQRHAQRAAAVEHAPSNGS